MICECGGDLYFKEDVSICSRCGQKMKWTIDEE